MNVTNHSKIIKSAVSPIFSVAFHFDNMDNLTQDALTLMCNLSLGVLEAVGFDGSGHGFAV